MFLNLLNQCDNVNVVKYVYVINCCYVVFNVLKMRTFITIFNSQISTMIKKFKARTNVFILAEVGNHICKEDYPINRTNIFESDNRVGLTPAE